MLRENKVLYLAILLSFIAPQVSKAKVYLYEQWHLRSRQHTQDINQSKMLPQYQNQYEIYKKISSQISSQNISTVISEGCEGNIDQSFTKNFNGWDYKRLSKHLSRKNYSDIMTLIPLKLEVKYKKKLLTICGDDLELIKKHQLAFSDLSGFLGFYARLSQYSKSDPKKYKLYLNALNKVHKYKGSPIDFTKSKAKESLENVKKYMHERNDRFVKLIKKHKGKSMAVVVGGLHIKDLAAKLKKSKIPYEVVSLKHSPKSQNELKKLESILK